METHVALGPNRHGGHQRSRSRFAGGVKGNSSHGNALFQAAGAGRCIKREVGDEPAKASLITPKVEALQDSSSSFLSISSSLFQQQGSHRVRVPQRISLLEPDVGAWLRDEPDAPTNSFLPPDSVGRNCAGSAGGDGNMAVRGVADGAGSVVLPSELLEAAQYKTNSKLLALLRSTKIKESVIFEGIQRMGGGQIGLQKMLGFIMFWLDAKNRHENNSQAGELCKSVSEVRPPRVLDFDQFMWSNLECGCVEDLQVGSVGSFGNFNPSSPTDPPMGLVSSPSSCKDSEGSLCDFRKGEGGSGEFGLEPNYESQLDTFIGGPEVVDGMQTHGPGPPQRDLRQMDWTGLIGVCATGQEKSHSARLIRKHSPSPDRSGVHCTMQAFDDTLSQQSKLRRHSPSPTSFTAASHSSTEFAGHWSTAAPEAMGSQGIFCPVGANPFAPGGAFNLSTSSPSPTQSMDFNAFGTQGSMLVDDNMGLGSSVHGCGLVDRLGSLGGFVYPLSPEGTPVDRKRTGSRLGVATKSRASPAACTRLARRQRMHRNRKAAQFQGSRVAQEAGPVLAGKAGGLCSPGSSRVLLRSQGSSASGGPACRTIDRRDQEKLQLLLQKVLKPSDVGNLGRIVLPKKDAETHLPWLGAREGIQFACEDYDTGEMITLRYRFWPNNKSRMYLLENTGDFVRRHQLQESDRMLIYRNQSQGTYIIRARKAQECMDGSDLTLGHSEDIEGDGKEVGDQNSPGYSGGTSSQSGESNLGSGQGGGSESCLPVPAIITSQDNLLNFADLPDAPMGEGTEHLVRFPSLESFDVELLELAPVTANEDVTSRRVKTEEE